jgi:hypothetical protein
MNCLADLNFVRKRLVFGFGALSLLSVIAVCLWLPPGRQVLGGLARQDVRAIVDIMHGRIGREAILPDFSWQSMRHLPSAISRPRGRILSIKAAGEEVQGRGSLSHKT